MITINRKHWGIVLFAKKFIRNGKFIFYPVPTIFYDYNMGRHSLKFIWLNIKLIISYFEVPFPESWYHTEIFGHEYYKREIKRAP